MKCMLVFGARPNFMKIAPLYKALCQRSGCSTILVHTGQHFDQAMSDSFINALGLPQPDVHLQVGSGTQAQQIARIMEKLEPVLQTTRPDVTVVVGDVSSTLAAALASATVDVPIAHVEAGLRSRDWSMPEERNRVLTDRLSQYLFTPSADADDNLVAEGIDRDRIFCVGNVMIDTLDWVLPRLPHKETRCKYNISCSRFALVTLHRPANVDHPQTLYPIVRGLEALGDRLPVYFAIHPRTQQRIKEFGIRFCEKRIRPLPPLSYPEFISLLSEAALVLTDSGGIQEEAAVLGVPCLTVRENTERPITLKFGFNELVRADEQAIVAAAERAIAKERRQAVRPPLWDGQAAERIIEILLDRAPIRKRTARWRLASAAAAASPYAGVHALHSSTAPVAASAARAKYARHADHDMTSLLEKQGISGLPTTDIS